jgi:hypothetical protein
MYVYISLYIYICIYIYIFIIYIYIYIYIFIIYIYIGIERTVAALHKIERRRKIMVFDMGLTRWQADQVKTWSDTVLVQLSEYSYPGALPWTRRTAALMYAVHAAGSALWLDPGAQVQRRISHLDVLLTCC